MAHMIASREGHKEIVKLLLAQGGIDANSGGVYLYCSIMIFQMNVMVLQNIIKVMVLQNIIKNKQNKSTFLTLYFGVFEIFWKFCFEITLLCVPHLWGPM